MHTIDSLIHQAIDAGQLPRVHGNGFIQLDVTPETRMHFWGNCEIPRANPMTPIHDHVFDFTSAVLLGEVLNINYNEHPSPTGLYDVNKAAPVKLGENGWAVLPTGERLDLTIRNMNQVGAGDGYFMPKNVLHQSICDGPCVTVITKLAPSLAQNPDGPKPRVLCLHRLDAFDIRFRRDGFDANKLWDIIRQITG